MMCAERNDFCLCRYALVCALSLLLSGFAGCSSVEHEEAEHHDPEHYPAEFSDAVAKLRLYREQLGDAASDAKTKEQAAQFGLDTWRWLPPLAASTDMPEAQWNQVDDLSLEYETQFVSSAGKPVEFNADQQAWWDKALTQLIPLADEYVHSRPRDPLVGLQAEATSEGETTETPVVTDASIEGE